MQGARTTPRSLQRRARSLESSTRQVPVAFKTLREIVFASLADRQLVLRLLASSAPWPSSRDDRRVQRRVLHERSSARRDRRSYGARGARPRRGALVVRQGAASPLAHRDRAAAAFASTRVSRAGCTAVGRVDPATFAVVAVALLVATLVASWVPAYRASRSDATEALRHE